MRIRASASAMPIISLYEDGRAQGALIYIAGVKLQVAPDRRDVKFVAARQA
jgi:hypothetical protein